MSHFISGRKYVHFFIGRKSVRRKSVRRKNVRRKNVRRKNVPVPAEGKTKSRHSDISTLYIFTRQVQVTGLRFKSLSSSGFISSGLLLALSAKSSNAQSRAPPFTARLLNNEFLCKRNIKIALGFPNLVNRREL